MESLFAPTAGDEGHDFDDLSDSGQDVMGQEDFGDVDDLGDDDLDR